MMGVQRVGGPEHPSLQRPGPGSRRTNGAWEGFFTRTFRFSVCIAQWHLSGCILKCHMRVQTGPDPFLICMSALHLSLSLHTVCLKPAVSDKAHSAKILKLYLFTVCTWQLNYCIPDNPELENIWPSTRKSRNSCLLTWGKSIYPIFMWEQCSDVTQQWQYSWGQGRMYLY